MASFKYNNNIRRMPIELCPTLRPTAEQFADFYAFTHFLDRTFKGQFGMVKVVPPKGWSGSAPDYAARLHRLDVAHPIEQNVQGTAGFFEARNIVQPRMTLRAYRRLSEQSSAAVSGRTPEQKEKLFWKTIMYSPPVYGADLTGTLMGAQAGEWDMNGLHSLLGYAMPYRVRGVTEPYCYIGAWKAFFSWHKEDLDLSAINYIHEGEPKVWYAVAAEDGHLLEAAARRRYPAQYNQCHEFLRHKTFLINPEALLRECPEIRICKAVHQAGEMVLVFGGAYHEGFNCGFNIAEAVNYATVDWLRQLLSTRSCACSRRSVRTEIESILYNLEESEMFERLLATEEFMQLRAYVQQQQQQEAQEEQQGQQGQQLEEVVSSENSSKAKTHKPKNKSKPIKKQKRAEKGRVDSTQSVPLLLEEDIKPSLTEVEQTKKSVTYDQL